MKLSFSHPAAWVLALSMALAGCAGLPPLENRTETRALGPETAATRIGQAATRLAAGHEGKTGVVSVSDGREAFGARVGLARAAMRSIDIQTFIWHDDGTGTMLFDEMLQAADRGVRVRLLLDDINMAGLDPLLALLDSHPNIEVRLYNPFASRGSRALGMVGDFTRLNHRMHNKSFTVDNQVAVVGGRNIADEYFEAGQDLSFADLDVMAIGQAVPAVSAEFDLYWNSESAYPASLIISEKPMSREAVTQRVQAWLAGPVGSGYREAVARAPQVRSLREGSLRPEWTAVRVVHDDPAKTLAPSSAEHLQLLPQLAKVLSTAASHVDLVSPYFVPGDAGTKALAALARRGVRVRVLTNSLAATDEASVHAGYAKRRRDLLEAGVQLFELRPTSATIRRRSAEIGSSATAGLHAKTFQVDGRTAFVGSFNLDPRSARLNTEMGMLIDSPTLAGRLAGYLDGVAPDLAYRVVLDEQGRMRWQDGSPSPLPDDPETTWTKRLKVRIFSWLPIEWLL